MAFKMVNILLPKDSKNWDMSTIKVELENQQ